VITLALDAATARCSVALEADGVVLGRHLDGPRRHTREVLGLVAALLREVGAAPGDIGRVLTGDGPGSFTGLRVAAAVAKGLCWGRPGVTWGTAPSLLLRAAAHVPAGGGTVLALADALRGELYAGWWRIADGQVVALGGHPRAVHPVALGDIPVDRVVGTIPDAVVAAVRKATGCEPILGDEALPDARQLLRLDRWSGGVIPVADPAAWQPTYGRPAEAQAVWERTHGRPLPDPTYHAG
jgi:tRNA threonylcarbamoyladenosine biosynthesis protein TsaB